MFDCVGNELHVGDNVVCSDGWKESTTWSTKHGENYVPPIELVEEY